MGFVHSLILNGFKTVRPWSDMPSAGSYILGKAFSFDHIAVVLLHYKPRPHVECFTIAALWGEGGIDKYKLQPRFQLQDLVCFSMYDNKAEFIQM